MAEGGEEEEEEGEEGDVAAEVNVTYTSPGFLTSLCLELRF